MAKDGQKPPRKRGRPKGPCNPKELAQRRSAAVKHGAWAQGVLRRTLPPCKGSHCPLGEDGFPCRVRDALAAQGKGLEVCPVSLVVSDETRERFRKAIVSGDLEDLAELPAALLAGMQELGEKELARLMEEGLVTDIEIPVEDGGTLSRPVENPRAKNLLKLLEMLGASGAQQGITPKSQGERKRDVSVSDHLDWMREMAEAQS